MADYFDKGFCVRRPSWHGKETLLAEYPESWDDARLAAGLMWEPAYRDVYGDPFIVANTELEIVPETGDLRVGEQLVKVVTTAESDKSYVLPIIDGFRRIVRDDTGATLAVPTDTFELIHHHQMGELLEAYTAAWRQAGATVKFETAGSVKGGRMVYALVFLDEPFTVTGDDSATYPYAALLNSHDGTGACKLLPTSVRVVCWNTFNAASIEGDRSGHQLINRHAGNVTDRLETAKASLATMRDEAKAWQMQAEDLAGININDAVLTAFIDEFIPVPENASERTRNARLDKQATFRSLYTASPTCADLPETAYKLTQAAGEYLDHLRPFRSSDTYLARTMFQPEPIKAGAITLIRELARDLVPA